MINIFNNGYKALKYTVTIDRNWDVLKTWYQLDMQRVLSYYRNKIAYVKNTNLFSRLIKNIDLDTSLDIFRYLERLESNYKYNSKTFGVVSDVNHGEVLDDEYFGKVVLINVDSGVDLFSLENSWKDVVPIRVIRHDYFGLEMAHPQDLENEDMGLVVIELDIKLLLVQYYHWANNRYSNEESIDSNIFVFQYPLTNSIPSILDLSILNRFYNLDIVEDNYTRKHPFYTRNLFYKTDKLLGKLYGRLKDTRMYYEEYLASIPLITSKNVYECLKLHTGRINANNTWVWYMARSLYTLEMIRTLGDKGIRLNKGIITEIRILYYKLNSQRLVSIFSNNKMDLEKDTYDKLLEITE